MIDIKIDTLSTDDIYNHFIHCKTPIVGKDLYEHSKKIRNFATTIEAWENNELCGMCACYMNNMDHKLAYITHIAVNPKYIRKGLGSRILVETENIAVRKGFDSIMLETDCNNHRAIEFYKKNGFEKVKETANKYVFLKRI